MANILVLTRGTGGDLFPLLEIGSLLKARGHAVIFITQSNFEESVRAAGFGFILLERPDQSDEQDESEPAWQALLSITPERAERFIVDAISTIRTMEEQHHSGATVVVSQSSLMLIGQTAAERLRVPHIPVFTAPYFIKTLECIAHSYNTLSSSANTIRAEFGLTPVQDWSAWLRTSRHSIGLWPEWFAPDAVGLGMVPVGFVASTRIETGEVPDEIREKLSSCKLPVLITHGTSRPAKAQFFSASTEACSISHVEPIVITQHDELLSKDSANATIWFKHLPFATLMPSMAAVIHHGGIGTAARALASGTPQLVLPFGYDRPDNGTRIRRLGVGDCLPPSRWQPSTIADSLRQLMESPAVRERCTDFRHRMNSERSSARACDVIELALQ